MKVLFYGPLAELLGPEMAVKGRSVNEIRDAITRTNPKAGRILSRSKAFAGGEMVQPDKLILADTIEFIPPVSGG